MELSGNQMRLSLARPSVIYRRSYVRSLRGFIRRKQTPRELLAIDVRPQDAIDDIPRLVHRLRGFARGLDLKPGYVPESIFWLVEGQHYLGEITIRHSLNQALRREFGHIGYEVTHSERRKGYGTRMLAMALKKTRTIGLQKVLVTCDTGNIGSRKIIEANGGKLAGKVKSIEGGYKYRFWIRIPS